ncbi:GntR family transcriptional regulator [Leifsonia sp. LS1]|uniref:GntR family transcriptional regulator n=1 Tax=Leifsonia sp. LS1 TaxID=2828483 RepID=UPI001CFD0F86|nr:GntR family transcriptional regulator [Leifsonia sp. LS1]
MTLNQLEMQNPSPRVPVAEPSWIRGLLPERMSGAVSSSKLILQALRESIVSGRIPEGEQLKQEELSRYFDVSPAPVREALRQLESEGLVEHRPNRGVFVTDLTGEEALGVLLPIRLLLEKYALLRVSIPLDAGLREALLREIQQMQAGADRADIAMINEADARFHEITVNASGAPHTIQLWHSVLPRIRRQLYNLTPLHADLHAVPLEHEALLASIEAGDADQLAAVLEEHIIGAATALINGAPHPDQSPLQTI